MNTRAAATLSVLVVAGCVDRPLAVPELHSSPDMARAPTCETTVVPTRMPEARGNLAAVTVGREMFIIGGRDYSSTGSDDGRPANIFFAYALETGVWRKPPPLPISILGEASAATDGKRIYVVQEGKAAAFDVAADQWTLLPPPPDERSNLALAVGADGRLYCFGGQRNDAFPDVATMTRFYVFDPGTMAWTARENAPQYGAGLMAIAQSTGAIYVGATTAHVYDPTSDSWSVHAAEGRYWSRGAQNGSGLMFAAGGSWPYLGGNGPESPLDEVRAYDASVGAWQTVTHSPQEAYMTGVAIGCDDRLYLFGGSGSSVVQAYDPATKTWQQSK